MKPGDRVLVDDGKVAHILVATWWDKWAEVACKPGWWHSRPRPAPSEASDCKRCARSKP